MTTQRSSGMARIDLAVRVIDTKNNMFFGVMLPNGTVSFYVDAGTIVPSGIKREAESLLKDVWIATKTS